MSETSNAQTLTAAPGDQPLGAAEFARLMADLAVLPPLAVAVSGGGDSMALLRLLLDWLGEDRRPPVSAGAAAPLTVLTVDHGLRPEAHAEALWVAGQARRLGLPHAVLTWDGDKPTANIQAAAREARYRLLEAWCRHHQVPALLTAHTQDDQAETLLLRLARGSGVDGLAAMAARTVLRDPTGRAGVELVRPLLSVPRARLRAGLERLGQGWVEDPANTDTRYARVRMRRLAGLLAQEGLTTARLAETADRLSRARDALKDWVAQVRRDGVMFEPAGHALLGSAVLLRAPEEVGLRVLAQVLQAVGGQPHPPRLRRLERVYGDWRDGAMARPRTLSGCRLAPLRGAGEILVTRESRHLGPDVTLEPGQAAVWDRRFRVALPRGPRARGGTVRALGREGYRALLASGLAPELLAGLPYPGRTALPALWRGPALVAVPGLGFDPEACGFKAVFLPRQGAMIHSSTGCEGPAE